MAKENVVVEVKVNGPEGTVEIKKANFVRRGSKNSRVEIEGEPVHEEGKRGRVVPNSTIRRLEDNANGDWGILPELKVSSKKAPKAENAAPKATKTTEVQPAKATTTTATVEADDDSIPADEPLNPPVAETEVDITA